MQKMLTLLVAWAVCNGCQVSSAICRMVKGRAGRGVAVLEVGKDNAAALSLYRKLGFQESFTRKGYYPDGSDAYSMRLRIN